MPYFYPNPSQAGRYFTYLGWMEGWVNLAVGYIPRCLQTVAHPSSNYLIATQLRVELMTFWSKSSTLPLSHQTIIYYTTSKLFITQSLFSIYCYMPNLFDHLLGWIYRNGRQSCAYPVSHLLSRCLLSVTLFSMSLELLSDFPPDFSFCMR